MVKVKVSRVLKASKTVFAKAVWADDSGASIHITNNKKALSNYTRLDPTDYVTISMADGSTTKGIGFGACTLGGVYLKRVLYAPEMELSLLSTIQLAKEGYVIVHRDNVGLIIDPKTQKTLLQTHYNEAEGLYIINSSQLRANERLRATVVRTSQEDNELRVTEYLRWHKRLGHVSHSRMREMANKGLVKGLKPGIFNLTKTPTCESCLLGKQTVKPHMEKIRNVPSIQPLERLFIDLVGPRTECTLTGKVPTDPPKGVRYFLTVVDDCTRYVWTLFLKSKLEVGKSLINLLNELDTQIPQFKVKRIRWDQALEFYSKEMKENINEPRGIISEPPGAYAHEQNGKVERMNRTVQTCARTMLLDSGLPEMFWPEAIRMATYVENRSYTRAAKGTGIPISSLHLGFDATPDISQLRPFGCKVMTSVPEEKRSKLIMSQPRAQPGVYLGPGLLANTFRVYDLIDKTLKVVRDVTFVEKEFPAKDELVYKQQFSGLNRIMPDILEVNGVLDGATTGPLSKGKSEVVGEMNETVLERQEMEREEIMEDASPTDSPIEPLPAQKRARSNSDPITTRDPLDEIRVTPISDSASQPLTWMELKTPVNFHSKNSRVKVKKRNWALAMRINAAKALLGDLPKTRDEAVHPDNPERKEWDAAIQEELKAHLKNKTWTKASNKEKENADSVLTVRWVFAKKPLPEGKVRYKARIVARGFEQRYGINYEETFSPTASAASIRLLIALAARGKARIHQMDVKTAFINSYVKEEVYIYPPPGYETNEPILRLRKALYGLKQAPRAWNDHIDAAFRKYGFKRCHSDYCVYVKDQVIVALYVDDILIISDNENEIINTKSFLRYEFEMEDMGEVKRFLGMDIKRMANGDYTINQRDYVRKILKRFGMHNCKPSKTPFSPGTKLQAFDGEASAEDRTTYQQIVGSLMYAATSTRPDIAFHVSTLSRFNNNPGPEHFHAAKNVMKYLKGTEDYGLTFKAGTTEDGLNFHGYTDSDWAGDLDNRRSTSGFVFLAAGAAISWRSRRQNTVATSTTEAEYVAAAMASKEALWLRQLLSELKQYYDSKSYLRKSTAKVQYHDNWFHEDDEQSLDHYASKTSTMAGTPIHCKVQDKDYDLYGLPPASTLPTTQIHCDNQGATALTRNPEQMKKTKHIDIAFHFVRERVGTGELKVDYIPTTDMVADGLTKPLSHAVHSAHMEAMGLTKLDVW